MLVSLIFLTNIFGLDLNYTLENFYLSSLLVVCFFPSSLTVVIALENFVGEKERNTLETLLLTPLTTVEIYWGKFFSSIIPPVFLGVLSFLIYFLGSLIFFKYILQFSFYLLIFLLILAKSLVLISGAIVISIHSKNIRSANLVSTIIVLPVTLLLIFEVHLLTKKIYTFLYFLILILLIYFLIFLKIGLENFERENLLVGDLQIKTIFFPFKYLLEEIKKIKLKKIIDILKEAFYLILKNRIHILIFSLIFTFFLIFSFIYSRYLINSLQVKYFPVEKIYRLPEEFTFLYILRHNLIALLISLILSPPTFGATGIIFVIIPAFMIGFFTGLSQPLTFKIILENLLCLIPHGIFEIPAAIISGVFIFRLGASLMMKEGKFFLKFVELLKILTIVIPLFIISAYFEVNRLKIFPLQ